jgi:hypothetical protein
MQAELKTKATDVDVAAYIAALDNPVRRADAEVLLDLFGRVTGEKPRMWGPSIIGYGRYRYRYDSGREGEMCRSGFSPRKANLVLYLLAAYGDPAVQARVDALFARLGKHKTGKSCLYINKLADVDMAVLEEILHIERAEVDARYPQLD